MVVRRSEEDVLEYVLANHEWCLQPKHACTGCGSNHYSVCPPRGPWCEGCQMEQKAKRILGETYVN